MKKGIIFDVDGTLWDASEQDAAACSRLLLRDYPEATGPVSREMILNTMGLTDAEITEVLFAYLPESERMDVLHACHDYELEYLAEHPGVLYPDVKEVLGELSARYGLYIVSNCQDGYIQVLLDSHGLSEYIEDFESFGRTGLEKHDNIRLVAERNSLDRCFYLGDTVKDEQACEKAGIDFVHAAYGFGTACKPKAVINSFRELTKVAESLLGGSILPERSEASF